MLVRNGRPNKYKKKHFPLLGLAVCSFCRCSITAKRQPLSTLENFKVGAVPAFKDMMGEGQKGHNYYRCTKKRAKCTQPYVREEHLALQVRDSIARVALPDDIFQKDRFELSAAPFPLTTVCPGGFWPPGPRFLICVPKGIRTPVAAVKGQCPRPLDDGDSFKNLMPPHQSSAAKPM